VFLMLLLWGILGRGRGMLDPMIDLRPFGVSNGVAGTDLFYAEAPGVVDWAWTGVIMSGHLVDGCIDRGVLFFWERGRVKAGAVL
jgi:hypothetical protein